MKKWLRFPANPLNEYQMFPGKAIGENGESLFGGYRGFFYLRKGRLQLFGTERLNHGMI